MYETFVAGGGGDTVMHIIVKLSTHQLVSEFHPWPVPSPSSHSILGSGC